MAAEPYLDNADMDEAYDEDSGEEYAEEDVEADVGREATEGHRLFDEETFLRKTLSSPTGHSATQEESLELEREYKFLPQFVTAE